MSIDNDPNTKQPLPPLPWTISEAARIHGVSITTVKKWIARNEVPYKRSGGAAVRAGVVLILSDKRPERHAHGTLTPEQRAAWNRGRKTKGREG